MGKLILIRHGETDDNLKKRYCGFSNPPLNATGILQSRALSRQLNDEDIAAVYASDLSRAVDTARIIFPSKTVIAMNEFREMNFGIFEGRTYEELMARHQEIYSGWLNDIFTVNIPSGEAFDDFCQRVRKGLAVILSRHPQGQTALVTHAGSARVILCDALGYEISRFWDIQQDNAGVNIIDYGEKYPVVHHMTECNFKMSGEII